MKEYMTAAVNKYFYRAECLKIAYFSRALSLYIMHIYKIVKNIKLKNILNCVRLYASQSTTANPVTALSFQVHRMYVGIEQDVKDAILA
jgi:chloramphenicol O-acetyltransferase